MTVVGAAVERTRAEQGLSLQLKAETGDLAVGVTALTPTVWRQSYSVALPWRAMRSAMSHRLSEVRTDDSRSMEARMVSSNSDMNPLPGTSTR